MSKLKGNLVIVQSGGPTAVINSSVAGVVLEAMKYPEIKEIYGGINGILGVLHENLIDLRKEGKKTVHGLRTTPSSALGSCRHKLDTRDLERIFKVLKAYNICYFFIAGGNDSMDTGNKVAKLAKEKNYQLRVIGIPKTIDNDLCHTDHCPGYASVARWLAIATRDAGLDTEAIYTSDTVKVIETMGRNSGWVTAATALAKRKKTDAPHLIYLPERPFVHEKFLADVEQVYRKLGYCVIAVCEGLKDKKGNTLVESKKKVDVDKFGHAQRGGVGQYLCDLVAENLKIKARTDKPGTIQRVSMVCASPVDLREAYEVARKAVQSAVCGHSGYMVSIQREYRISGRYTFCTRLVELERVANKIRLVPEEYINRQGNFVSQEFYEYARPLIGPLPRYTRLKKHFVKKRLPTYK